MPARRILIPMIDLASGGSERIALRLANAWARAGRDVTVVCGAADGPLSPLVEPGVRLVATDPTLRRGRGARRRFGRQVAGRMQALKPDLIFVPGNYQWPMLPELAALPSSERPPIVTQISTPMYRPGRNALAQIEYNWRTRRRLRVAQAAVSLADSMTEDADRVLGRRITTRLPLPALDDETDGGLSPASGDLIVAAGRLVHVKRFDIAIHALAALPSRRTRLVILGEGPLRADLEAQAARLGVADRVEMPGFVPDIRPWLAKARVFLLTSRYEGYAAVLLEALNAGRPVVTTDCTPAADEILTSPACGAVARMGDPKAVARALHLVMSARAPDPSELRALVDPFRIGAVARAYLDLFDSVAEPPR